MKFSIFCLKIAGIGKLGFGGLLGGYLNECPVKLYESFVKVEFYF